MFVQKPDILTLDSCLADLPSHDFQVSLTTLGEIAATEFKNQPELPGVMITTDSQIVGMISRVRFFERLSSRFGQELFLKRPIQLLWEMMSADAEANLDAETRVKKYLLLNGKCTIDKAVEIALKRPSFLTYEPIVIEGADGQWRLLDMQILLLAQSDLFSQAKKAADAANRAKSDFLASMSHELRTPLNAILGFTQVINRDPSLSKEHQQHLGIISRAGEHLLELINDVLDMSKIEAGRITFNESSFDLYRLLDNLREMLELKALSKGLRLIFEHNPDVPQYVQTDEGKLRQVLINLLSNAIKFTDWGSITVRVARKLNGREERLQPVTLTFEVEDTGPGIAPEEMDQLFAAFGQTETGRKSQQGTGLGLPISQRFVQLMGGEIAVSSNLGQGTTFAFDVLVKPANVADISNTQETHKVIGLAPDQPKYRILAVDDRPENRLLLVKMLTSLGFCVREAQNGQEAVELWSSYSPNLILMDMRMPVMNGYEATKNIKAKLKGQATVIIALTATSSEEERNIALSTGCDDFLRKPFREEVLLEKIAKYLGVRYLYKQPVVKVEEIQGELATSNESLSLHLSQMPSEWIEQLDLAASKCSDRAITQLVQQIPEAHAPLANVLEDWANDYLFDRITDLIQTNRAEEPEMAMNN